MHSCEQCRHPRYTTSAVNSLGALELNVRAMGAMMASRYRNIWISRNTWPSRTEVFAVRKVGEFTMYGKEKPVLIGELARSKESSILAINDDHTQPIVLRE